MTITLGVTGIINSLDKLLNELLLISNNIEYINQQDNFIHVSFISSYTPTTVVIESLQNVVDNFVDQETEQNIEISHSLIATTGILKSTNPSTSISTGALVCQGGIGVAGEIFVGQDSTFFGNINIPNGNIILSNDATLSTHAVRKQYVDSNLAVAGTGLTKTGIVMSVNSTQSQITSIGSNVGLTIPGILYITNSTASNSHGTGSLVVSGGLSIADNVFINKGLTINSTMNVANNRIINLLDPINPTDAVNRQYVDSVAQGLSIKDSVKVASTTSINLATLSTNSTIDGITLMEGDRILLKNQTDGVENGIYVIGSSAPPTRSSDLPNGSNALNCFTFVTMGNQNAQSGWANSNIGTTIVGTDVVTFSQFSSAGLITAGPGIQKSGNTLSVLPDNTSIELNGTSFRLSSGAIGIGLSGGSGSVITVNSNLNHVTGLGTITSGTWNGERISVSYGGTGRTSITTNNVIYGNGTSQFQDNNSFTFVTDKLNVPNINITATTISTSTTTGSLTVSGGMGISGSVFVGLNMSVLGNSTFTGTVSVPTPINANNASTKSYVDNLTYFTAGTGLTKLSGVISVNPTLTHVTSLGTLTGLTSSGIIYVTNTTAATGANTGAIQISGGMYINGSVITNSNLFVNGTSTFIGTVSVPIPMNATDASTKSYTDGLTYITAGTGLTKTGSTFSVNSIQSQITSLGILTGLTSSGIISISSTTNSTSPSTGSLVTLGGLGITKNVSVGGDISTITSGYKYNMKTVSTTYTIESSDHYIACNTSSGAFTVTLPSTSGQTGKCYIISKTSNDNNILTILTQSGETIAESDTFTLTVAYAYIKLIATSTSIWNIVELSPNKSTADVLYAYGSVYGIGNDGDVTISVNTTLARDMYYNNLTINSGVVLNPAGWRIFVKNTLTFANNTSTIQSNGTNATNNIAGLAGSPYADLYAQTHTTFLGGGLNGANGRTTSGNGITATSYSTNDVSIAGSGGSGGNSTGNTGGAGGTMSPIPSKDGGTNVIKGLPYALGRGILSFYNIAFNGGTGGGSGACSSGSGSGLKSGGGGGGGGCIVICARILSAPNGGIISVSGGNGGNASASVLGSATLGGGGGGGGGLISLVTHTEYELLDLTINVSGGTGGTKLGTNGTNGQNGSPGYFILNQI